MLVSSPCFSPFQRTFLLPYERGWLFCVGLLLCVLVWVFANGVSLTTALLVIVRNHAPSKGSLIVYVQLKDGVSPKTQ